MNEAGRQAVRYRFGDIVVEPGSRRLTVGGSERPVSRRAFDLLLMLCESPGRVLARDEVAERLWPGGQVVSDESLTQAIFRTRAVLGEQAEALVTVRGVGIRFDAPVRRESIDTAPAAANGESEAPFEVPASREPAAEPAPDRPVATSRMPTPRAPGPRRLAVSLGGVALLLLAIAVWRVAGPSDWIDQGYGLRSGDVHAGRPETARLLAEAMAHDNRGDRSRAKALLEAVAASDTRTPWPPLLLGLWATGAADGIAADDWLARARERAAPLRDPYVAAMLRYVEAERAAITADTLRYAGAVLDLRPQAWRMHLARAHLRSYQGLREAALAEIRRIDIPQLGNRKLEMALADRASYGDIAGAQAVLDRIPRGDDEAAWHFLEGRIAWSRGDRAAARRAWKLAAERAQIGDRDDIASQARALAGLAAMLDGDAEATGLFEAARVGAGERHAIREEADLSVLLALLHAQAGDEAKARGEFAAATRLARGSSDTTLNTALTLTGLRLFPDVAEAGLVLDPAPAAQTVLSARRAIVRGDRAAAHDELAAAIQRGALAGYWKDETRLLAAELGEPVAAEQPFDPPFPPLSLIGARIALSNRAQNR